MTRTVALIGNPLRRRHSVVMHNAAFAAHDIDATYELRPIDSAEVPDFFSEVRHPEWLGFGVTAPYKQVAMEHIDLVEPGARAIGAVNNGMRQQDGTLVGFNTDADGFLSAVRSTGRSIAGEHAVVVGAGGAARAVVWALLDAGAGSVFVANRTRERAVSLAEDMSSRGPVSAGSLDGPALADSLQSAAIAVNATTVGMSSGGLPFQVDLLPGSALVFDLVYAPPETPLLRAADARGLQVCNGLEMLVRQGEIAFERWTGIGGTADIMRTALEEWISDSEG